MPLTDTAPVEPCGQVVVNNNVSRFISGTRPGEGKQRSHTYTEYATRAIHAEYASQGDGGAVVSGRLNEPDSLRTKVKGMIVAGVTRAFHHHKKTYMTNFQYKYFDGSECLMIEKDHFIPKVMLPRPANVLSAGTQIGIG